MTQDDLAVFLPLLIYGLAAALVGYLVGTWPRKRQPVETIDTIMSGFPGESTPTLHASANATLRVQQEMWDRNAAEAQTLANALTESPDAGRASPGAEAAATDASVPVEKGRPDQETGGPAASDLDIEIVEPTEEERRAPGAYSTSHLDDRDFTAGVPRVPCATPHLDQHAPGFAARARKAKAKKGKK